MTYQGETVFRPDAIIRFVDRVCGNGLFDLCLNWVVNMFMVVEDEVVSPVFARLYCPRYQILSY